MPLRFVLLVLPALVLAKIYVNFSGEFIGGLTNVRISYGGRDVGIITDTEKNTFNLSDYNLKKAVELYDGDYPDDVFLRRPTPWGDLYRTYGWHEVRRTLKPISGKILKMSYKPDIIFQRAIENNSSKPKISDISISQEVQNSVSSSWNTEGELTVVNTINYSIKFIVEVGGKNSFAYTSSWAKNTEQTQTMIAGATSNIEIVLQPGQSVVTQLHVTKLYVQIQMEYEASLDGHVAANYYFTYRDHHFIPYDIDACMQSGGISNRKVSREVIDIGFYVNPTVVVLN